MINIPEVLQERYNKPHLSYSSLKVALTDMAKFDQYMKGELKFSSPALTFGTLYDMLLFEKIGHGHVHYSITRHDHGSLFRQNDVQASQTHE